MNTENTVTINLRDYEDLKRSNEGMKKAIKGLSKNKIAISEGNLWRTQVIVNPDEAIIKINEKLTEATKDLSIVSQRETEQKTKFNNAARMWMIIIFILLVYSAFSTVLLCSK